MILQKKELQNFFSLTSMIVSNNIIPIYDYLMLTPEGRLVKTNGAIFVSTQVSVSKPLDVPVLLESKVVEAFVKLAKSQEITVQVKGKSVIMSDGFGSSKFQTVDAKDFPAMPSFDESSAIEISAEALESIGIASKNVSKVGGNANMDFVHAHKNYIFATDRTKLYTKKIEGIPDMVIDTVCASIISQFGVAIDFYENDSHVFFKAGQTLYGFQKYGDVKSPDLTPFLNYPLEQHFEFNAADLLYFCDLVTMTSTSLSKVVLTSRMQGGKLSYIGKELNSEADVTIEHSGDYEPDIYFNPKHWSPYFKSIGKNTIRFHPFPAGVFITDQEDKDFLGMISKVDPNVLN